MYPVYIEIAKFQGEREAEVSFTYAYRAEQIHAELYKEAKKSVDEGKDFELKGKVWICPVCGYTHMGDEPPEKCPVCGARREAFKGF